MKYLVKKDGITVYFSLVFEMKPKQQNTDVLHVDM